MFKACEFTFAGKSSVMFGLVVCDFESHSQSNVGFGNNASIIESRTNTRVDPIHLGVNYHGSPLEFKLVFGAERALDRYELESVAMWLTGHQEYQWLTIDQDDLRHVQYKCLITSMTPLSFGWYPHAFEATVRCDCSYAYGYPFTREFLVSGSGQFTFQNESSVREYVKPELFIQVNSGATSLSIINHSDNDREFSLTTLPAAGGQVYVDNANGIIQDTVGGINLYNGFNMNFFRLVHGTNRLTMTGRCVVTMKGRLYHNTAG